MDSHYIVTAMYHPKPSMEKEFLNICEERLLNHAYKSGATSFCIYYSDETGEFLSISHWKDMSGMEKFFESPEMGHITSEINRVCLIPATKEIYSILKEEKKEKKAA